MIAVEPHDLEIEVRPRICAWVERWVTGHGNDHVVRRERVNPLGAGRDVPSDRGLAPLPHRPTVDRFTGAGSVGRHLHHDGDSDDHRHDEDRKHGESDQQRPQATAAARRRRTRSLGWSLIRWPHSHQGILLASAGT